MLFSFLSVQAGPLTVREEDRVLGQLAWFATILVQKKDAHDWLHTSHIDYHFRK